MTRVFVYGSLMRGLHNHVHFLGGAKYLGAARAVAVADPNSTWTGFTLLDLGTHPGVVSGDGSVKGEVYEVDDETLESLDCLEGVAHGFYARHTVTTTRGEAEMYLLARPSRYASRPEVPDGDWRAYLVKNHRARA